jgi:hypothetical protein
MFDTSSNTMFEICHWRSAECSVTLGEWAEQFRQGTVSSRLSVLQSVSLSVCLSVRGEKVDSH